MQKRLLFILFFFFSFHFSYSQNPLVKQWDARFGGDSYDFLFSLQQTRDGGYILGGYSWSGLGGDKSQALIGSCDYWVVKTDSLGNKEWDKDFGGTAQEETCTIKQTKDGGYILGGSSNSGIGGNKSQAAFGLYDYWVVKIDSLGIKKWDKVFGGTDDDRLVSFQQTRDGGYILGGYSSSGISGNKTQASFGVADYWVVKLDALGTKKWDKVFGGTSWDFIYSIQQTGDGGYILGGITQSGIGGNKTQVSYGNDDYWIVKIDLLGNYQWDKDFGGASQDEFYSLQQTRDKGYILGGSSLSGISGNKTQASKGAYDYWIIKTDSLGIKQWEKSFGGSLDEDEFNQVSQTSDGGFLLSGASNSQMSGSKSENNLGSRQSWIVKTDSLGIKQWDKTIFTTCHNESGFAIQTKDGCYAVANYSNNNFSCTAGGYKTQSDIGNGDYWIIKFRDTTQSTLPHANFISSDSIFCNEGGACIDFTDLSTGTPTSWKWSFPGAVPDTSTQQNPKNICYYVPGSYAVTLIVSNASGIDSLTKNPKIIFDETPPLIITISHDTLFCPYAVSYQWYYNGSPIPGATDSFYVATLGGLYNVYFTDSYGCSRLGIGVDFVGVNELNVGASFISIYPNPVGESLVISHWSLAVNSTICIYNVLGEKVLQSEITNQNRSTELTSKSEINVAAWAKGIYMVEVIAGEKIYRAKFVKE